MYIYIYISWISATRLESPYSFGKIQRTVVLFNLSCLSYLMEMYIFIDKRCLFKPFSYENYCRQSAIK